MIKVVAILIERNNNYLIAKRLTGNPNVFGKWEFSIGKASSYVYLGKCDYVSHNGSRPVSIIWKLIHKITGKYLEDIHRNIIDDYQKLADSTVMDIP